MWANIIFVAPEESQTCNYLPANSDCIVFVLIKLGYPHSCLFIIQQLFNFTDITFTT